MSRRRKKEQPRHSQLWRDCLRVAIEFVGNRPTNKRLERRWKQNHYRRAVAMYQVAEATK